MKRVLATLVLWPVLVRADGIAVVLTGVSIPPQTVSVIDPVAGSSSGGAADMRLGPGDIVTFRFRYVPVPDNNGALDGMQAYLTAYVPANTQVVGARILSEEDDGANAVAPRWPGISVDQSSGGSISQVYADTGIFVAGSSSLTRSPLAELLRFDNGIEISEPAQAITIASILGSNGADVRAHNAWDAGNANVFGIGGTTPLGRGSPVAGLDTFYANDNTNTPGPWSRVRYAGSLIGYNPSGASDILRRTVLDASELGLDLSPAVVSLPPVAGAHAVRFALGDVRVGRPGSAEISLRVVQTPLESGPGTLNDNVLCAEIFAGDSSKRNPLTSGPGAADNPWGTFIPVPACASLKVQFDLRVDPPLALSGQTLTWTLTGKNLLLNPQSNVRVYLGYDTSKGQVLQVQPPASAVVCPVEIGASGLTCQRWNLGDLAPSEAFTRTVTWNVGVGGNTVNRFRALFESDQFPLPGQTTQAIALVEPIPVFDGTASLDAPTGDAFPIAALYGNVGSGSANVTDVGIYVPEGWSVSSINVPGQVQCDGPFTTEALCPVNFSLAPGATQPMTFAVKPSADAPVGLYPVHISLWATANGFGGEGENLFPNVAAIPIGSVRSAAPSVNCPIPVDATAITGSSVGEATVNLYFDRSLRGSTTGPTWSYSDFTATFGALYGGIEVRATAQVSGELESEMSAPCIVSSVADTIFSDGFEI